MSGLVDNVDLYLCNCSNVEVDLNGDGLASNRRSWWFDAFDATIKRPYATELRCAIFK
jgi:hypothetical protein